MNIQDALKSGRPFKRPHNTYWTYYDPEKSNGWFYCDEYSDEIPLGEDGGTSLDLYYEDLLADDWIIKVTIS